MDTLRKTSLYKYVQAIRALPKGIFNINLFLSAALFATAGTPKGWDEGSAAAITQLKSFQTEFHLDSTKDNATISNLVSFVNLGAGIGALLSFLVNDRIGRIWSMRVYHTVYVIGTLISCFSYGNLGALYTGRIISGLGIGACTVVGPMAIAEIAPKTVRGLMTLWVNVAMLVGQTLGIFTVYGCSINIPSTLRLQSQIPWFVQTFVPAIAVIMSFFATESPRWLAIKNRPEEVLEALTKLRGLPQSHAYVQEEYQILRAHIESETDQYGQLSLMSAFKETFFVRSNLRRVQLTIIAYILAQFSGANSITNYLPTILGLVGVKSDNTKLLSSGMYAVTKLICTAIASLVFVDMVGRRGSLLTGITVQAICHSYLAGYLRYFIKSPATIPTSASDGAIAIIYIHAFGWAVGLYTLPYLFGAELWPNRIRSFGGALSQSFHWLFYFAITKATPSLISSLNTWGAFLFFMAWCIIALGYTYFFVPETSGLSLDDLDRIFERHIYQLRQPLSREPEDHDERIQKAGDVHHIETRKGLPA
ncbi:hypothetical protein E8E14_014841 [Neopestalotiopsis sp. 37M]|nr:hypothetical protein E8E14_014841 [Neopestalotiopsis sp. 37M]